MADHPSNMTSGLRAQESLFDRRLLQLRSTGQIQAQRKPPMPAVQTYTQFGSESNDSRISAKTDNPEISEMERIAFIDPLTEQLNSRTILGRLKKEVSRARRYRQPLAVVVIEIDGLSNMVARASALTFETLIKNISQTLTKNIRDVDRCGFYDDNKFMLVCPETNLVQASILAERLRDRFSLSKVGHLNGAFAVTVSAGISSFPENGDSDQDLLNSAFKALNDAISKGGNLVASTFDSATPNGSFGQYLEKEIPSDFPQTSAPAAQPIKPVQQIQPAQQLQQQQLQPQQQQAQQVQPQQQVPQPQIQQVQQVQQRQAQPQQVPQAQVQPQQVPQPQIQPAPPVGPSVATAPPTQVT